MDFTEDLFKILSEIKEVESRFNWLIRCLKPHFKDKTCWAVRETKTVFDEVCQEIDLLDQYSHDLEKFINMLGLLSPRPEKGS